MRIALFHNVPSGGAKRAIYEWVRRLVGNHTIDVYSISSADHAYCDIRPIVHKHNIYPFETRGLFKSPLGRLNQLQRWQDLSDLDRLHRSIAADINPQSYDLLFANSCIFTFIPAIIEYIKVPAIYYLHEPYGSGFLRQLKRPYLRTVTWRKFLNKYDPLINLYQHKLTKIQKNSSAKAGLLLANSLFTSECMQSEYQKKTRICPLGVDIINLKPIPGIQKENLIVSVGEMSPRKGFDFIIESLSYISQQNRPQLKLACNNIEPQEKEYIINLANKCSVELEILTRLNTEELKKLYNQARLCVYAPYMEPFGLVPLESMACGTPVVSVKEGGVQESILHEETGLLIERNPIKFSEGILRLLLDPELAATYGRNGREHVASHWTWEQSTEKLEAYLIQFRNLG